MREFYGKTARFMALRTTVAILLGASLLHAEDKATAKVPLRSVSTAKARPRLLFPRLPIRLQTAPQEGFPNVSKRGRCASLRAGGKELRFGLDAPEGSYALGQLVTGEGAPAVGRAEAEGAGRFRVRFSDVEIDGVPINVSLRYRGTKLVEAIAEPARHRRGNVVFEGVVRDVVLVDMDGDGRYDGVEDRWIALRGDRARKVTTLRAPAMSLLDEPLVPFLEDGTALMVRHVAADGSSLELVRGTPGKPLDLVLTRRYFEFRGEYFQRFREDEAAFIARSGMDAARKRTPRTANWPRTSLASAQARARKSGKPLLVAYYTETNDWWWRYHFTTFRDAEIDRLLRRFERVAIDAEKDREKSFQKSGARGLPTLQFWTPDGRLIEFDLRARDSDGKLRELGRTQQGVTGWQRPGDLVVNLRRVLDTLRKR
ncbi:MAG: hypothetical protein AAGD14_01120 [Planctomycetota bacterium]